MAASGKTFGIPSLPAGRSEIPPGKLIGSFFCLALSASGRLIVPGEAEKQKTDDDHGDQDYHGWAPFR